MTRRIAGIVNIVHEAKQENVHVFDKIEQYWTFVRALPRRELREPAGVPLAATHQPFTLSLLLVLSDFHIPEFPTHVEIDVHSSSHADIGGRPMVVSFSENTDARTYSAIVKGFFNAHTSLVAIATAPSVEQRDDLLSCLATLRVVRAVSGEV